MALDFECPACQANLRAEDQLIEQAVRCSKCAALLYLASPEKPLPDLCDMAQGTEPLVVEPRPAMREPIPAPAPTPIEPPAGGAL